MHHTYVPWHLILMGLLKLLKLFGVLPGAAAAFGIKRIYQKRRAAQAASGWPATDATIQHGEVHKKGWRNVWAELTYTYYVGEYRTGKYLRKFHREEDADEFVRQVKDKRVHLHYNPSAPDQSVILDRDIELVAMLAPQFR